MYKYNDVDAWIHIPRRLLDSLQQLRLMMFHIPSSTNPKQITFPTFPPLIWRGVCESKMRDDIWKCATEIWKCVVVDG